MRRVEEIDHAQVALVVHRDFQLVEQTRAGRPEIIANHEQELDVYAVGLTQGRDQRTGGQSAGVAEQPLFQLIDDDEGLLARL